MGALSSESHVLIPSHEVRISIHEFWWDLPIQLTYFSLFMLALLLSIPFYHNYAGNYNNLFLAITHFFLGLPAWQLYSMDSELAAPQVYCFLRAGSKLVGQGSFY